MGRRRRGALVDALRVGEASRARRVRRIVRGVDIRRVGMGDGRRMAGVHRRRCLLSTLPMLCTARVVRRFYACSCLHLEIG